MVWEPVLRKYWGQGIELFILILFLKWVLRCILVWGPLKDPFTRFFNFQGWEDILEHRMFRNKHPWNPPHIIYLHHTITNGGLPRWLSGKEPACQSRRYKRLGFNPWVRKIPWWRKWQPTPVFLPGKSHGKRNLAGYSPWGHKSRTRLKWLSTHTHITNGTRKLQTIRSQTKD